MAELPEVEQFAQAIRADGLGHVVVSAEISDERPLREVTPASIRAELVGKRITAVRRHGDLLFVAIGSVRTGSDGEPEPDGHLLLRFGPAGALSIGSAGAQPSISERISLPLVMTLDDGTVFHVTVSPNLGFIGWVHEVDAYLAAHRIGPDPLSDGLDAASFAARLEGRSGPIKSCLADETVLCGLGPIWSDEVLYQARIHPETRVEALSAPDIRAMFDALREVLPIAVSTVGGPHNLPSWMMTHRRFSDNRTDPETGATFTKSFVNGIASYYSPELQKL